MHTVKSVSLVRIRFSSAGSSLPPAVLDRQPYARLGALAVDTSARLAVDSDDEGGCGRQPDSSPAPVDCCLLLLLGRSGGQPRRRRQRKGDDDCLVYHGLCNSGAVALHTYPTCMCMVYVQHCCSRSGLQTTQGPRLGPIRCFRLDGLHWTGLH